MKIVALTAGLFTGGSMFITTAGGYYLTAANDDSSLFEPEIALILGLILGGSAALVNCHTTYKTYMERIGSKFEKMHTVWQEIIPALMGVSVAIVTAAWLYSFSEAFNEEMDIQNPAIVWTILGLGVIPCTLVWGIGAWLFIRDFCVGEQGCWKALQNEKEAIQGEFNKLSPHQKNAALLLGTGFTLGSLISIGFSAVSAWDSLASIAGEEIALALVTITTLSGFLFFERSSVVAAIEISKKAVDFSQKSIGYTLLSVLLFCLNAISSSLPSLNGANVLGAGPAGQGVGFSCAFFTSLAVNNGHAKYVKTTATSAVK